jgi:hypothetical protein
LRARSGRLVFPGCPSHHAHGQRRSTASWQRLPERGRGQVGKRASASAAGQCGAGPCGLMPSSASNRRGLGLRLYARGTPVAFKGAADAAAPARRRLEPRDLNVARRVDSAKFEPKWDPNAPGRRLTLATCAGPTVVWPACGPLPSAFRGPRDARNAGAHCFIFSLFHCSNNLCNFRSLRSHRSLRSSPPSLRPQAAPLHGPVTSPGSGRHRVSPPPAAARRTTVRPSGAEPGGVGTAQSPSPGSMEAVRPR